MAHGQIRLTDMFNESINYERPPAVRDTVGLLPSWSNKLVLDFGCGDAPNRRRLESAGARWVGIDIIGSAAAVRCDGHALPFKDQTFDAVVADAVFEHLLNPFQAAQEIARVSKRGAEFVGYVAFLEPFHMSYFHHSHKGVEHLLTSTGFKVTDNLPTRPGVEKLVEDLMFPRQVRFLSRAVSTTIRGALYAIKQVLRTGVAVALALMNESPEVQRMKRRLYRRFLEIGYSGGILFRGIKQ